MKKKRYSSDQINGEWKHIKGLLPKAKPGGRHRTTDLREVVNAIFYLIRGGISWQNLPKDFPPYKTVYDYFRKWRLQGVWKAIHDRLRDKVRQLMGRKTHQLLELSIARASKRLLLAASAADTTPGRKSPGASATCW